MVLYISGISGRIHKFDGIADMSLLVILKIDAAVKAIAD